MRARRTGNKMTAPVTINLYERTPLYVFGRGGNGSVITLGLCGRDGRQT